MPRHRDRFALLEAMRRHPKGSSATSVPKWYHRPRRPADAGHAPPDSPPAAPGADDEPVCWVEAGRLHLSLNGLSCVLAVAGLILALSGSFMWGRRTGLGDAGGRGAAATDGIADAAAGAPDPSILGILPGRQRTADPDAAGRNAGGNGRSREVTTDAVVEPDATGRKSGLNYLVAQNFRQARTHAEHAREFLREHGVDCSVERVGGDWTVICFEGHEHLTRNPAALRHRARVAELGKQYSPVSPGRYKLEGYWVQWPPG